MLWAMLALVSQESGLLLLTTALLLEWLKISAFCALPHQGGTGYSVTSQLPAATLPYMAILPAQFG